MNLEIIGTPSLALPVATLNEWLRVNDTAEDTLHTALIRAATEMVERWTGYTLTTTTYRVNLDPFDYEFRLPRRPVGSVTSVEYLNTSGSWSPVTYSADLVSGTITIDPNTAYTVHSWKTPVLRCQFVTASTLPDNAKELALVALKQLVTHWTENRSAVGNETELPLGFADICNIIRGGRIG